MFHIASGFIGRNAESRTVSRARSPPLSTVSLSFLPERTISAQRQVLRVEEVPVRAFEKQLLARTSFGNFIVYALIYSH
jgi:hypothetical protein